MTHVCQQISEVQLGSYYLTHLECVDDTTLLSNIAAYLEAGHNVFEEEASKLNLEVSWERNQGDQHWRWPRSTINNLQ